MNTHGNKFGDILSHLPEDFSVFQNFEEVFDERNNVKIQYAFFKDCNGGKGSIYLICPACGELGRLIVSKRTAYGRKYRILHGRGRRDCSISYSSHYYPAVDDVYSRASKQRQSCARKGEKPRKRSKRPSSRNRR